MFVLAGFAVQTRVPLSLYENSNPKETDALPKTSATFTRSLDEFLVNNYTINNQQNPSICNLTSDTFAVAWASGGQDPGDGINVYGVYASVFDATTGKNITNEFRVNQETSYDQQNPSISALSNDTFAVAWQSNLDRKSVV